MTVPPQYTAVAQGSRHGAGAHSELGADTAERAVAAFARAVRLSCLAARRNAPQPERAALANQAVAAHMDAQALAEEAVRKAGA